MKRLLIITSVFVMIAFSKCLAADTEPLTQIDAKFLSVSKTNGLIYMQVKRKTVEFKGADLDAMKTLDAIVHEHRAIINIFLILHSIYNNMKNDDDRLFVTRAIQKQYELLGDYSKKIETDQFAIELMLNQAQHANLIVNGNKLKDLLSEIPALIKSYSLNKTVK